MSQGLVLSTVTYNDDGRVRPLFYRLSLAEMGECPAFKFAFGTSAKNPQSFPMRLPRYVEYSKGKVTV